jgi:hypothetical protein
MNYKLLFQSFQIELNFNYHLNEMLVSNIIYVGVNLLGGDLQSIFIVFSRKKEKK